MKTAVYVDGFNLYYGCLHRTPYKWLDMPRLIETIVTIQNPKASVVHYRYFTADVPTKFSNKGAIANQAQDQYLKALALKYRDSITVHKGYYSKEPYDAYPYSDPPDLSQVIRVWKLEEKQTDVAMGTYCYRDLVVRPEIQQVVLCTNDTDLEPPLALIKKDRPDIQIGIIIPRSKDGRTANSRLSKYANWTRSHILPDELQDSLLPDTISGQIGRRTKVARKPEHW